MGITVREALALPEMAGIKVVAGAAGLDRIIRTVNVMEVPDISSYVDRGELLLTTTYPIRNDQQALLALVPSLEERGLAGLAIKPARYLEEIPPEMIAQAEELGFPLLCLPEGTAFARILNPLLSEILHRQAALLRRSEWVHRSLTDLVLKGEGLPAVARTLSSILEMPVVLTDDLLRVLAVAGLSDMADQIWEQVAGQVQEPDLLVAGRYPLQLTVQIDGQPASWKVEPVRVGTEVCGYLWVWEREREFRERDEVCVEQASLVTALELQKQRAVQETERRFRNSFLYELLMGRITSKEEAIARGTTYGWDLTSPRVILALRSVSPNGQASPLKQQLRYQAQIERTVHRVLDGAGVRYIIGHLGDTTMLLLVPSQWADEAAKVEAVRLAQRLVQDASSGQRYDLCVGIGQYLADVAQFAEGHRQATEALRVALAGDAVDPVLHYDDLGVYRLIVRVGDAEELQRFCQQRLGHLLAYDAKHDSNLLETLKAVVQADGNLQQAADRLHVHYNTLRYRLQRVQEIQGMRLDSWSDIAELSIALRAYEFIKSRRPFA